MTRKRDLCADLADDPKWRPPYDPSEDQLIPCGWLQQPGRLIRLWLRMHKGNPDDEIALWVVWQDARGNMDERYACVGARDEHFADLGLGPDVPKWRQEAYRQLWDLWKQGAR